MKYIREQTQKEIKAIDTVRGKVTNNLIYNIEEKGKLESLVKEEKARVYYSVRDTKTKTIVYKIEKVYNKDYHTNTIRRTAYNLPKSTQKTKSSKSTEIDIDSLSKSDIAKLITKLL